MLERLAELFDRQWLAGTQTLGEIADLVSEFRIDEDRLADATDPHTASERGATAAKYSAEMRAYEISKRRETYLALPQAADDAHLLAAFDSNWKAYLKSHREWAALPTKERRATLGWVSIRLNLHYEDDEARDRRAHRIEPCACRCGARSWGVDRPGLGSRSVGSRAVGRVPRRLG